MLPSLSATGNRFSAPDWSLNKNGGSRDIVTGENILPEKAENCANENKGSCGEPLHDGA